MQVSTLSPEQAALLLPLLHQVHAVHVAAQPTRYPPIRDNGAVVDFLQDWLRDPAVTTLIAGPMDAPIGYAVFEIQQRPAHPLRYARDLGMLHHICVDTHHRRQGVARALFASMRAHLAEHGITQVATTYGAFNTASAALMASEGLTPTTIFAQSFDP